MAMTLVSGSYHGFIFDGENSRDYGVYITKPAVFNSPERDVDFITIPGRNGDYALDNGRFKNITVAYDCAVSGGTEEDFAEAVSAIRNMLASRKGYKRLTDEINNGEYRMACFNAGIDITTLNPRTGTFTVEFMCKPQRFLTSGESAVSVASGGTIENPTLFDSFPVLEVYGYGKAYFDGEEVLAINDVPLGIIKPKVASQKTVGQTLVTFTDTVDGTFIRTGNAVSFGDVFVNLFIAGSDVVSVRNVVGSGCDAFVPGEIVTENVFALFIRKSGATTFYWGTPEPSVFSCEATMTVRHGNATMETVTVSMLTAYDGQNTITTTVTLSASSAFSISECQGGFAVRANSTYPSLGEPIYIDTEIGQAWKVEEGEFVSVNNAVALPVTLPVLPPGETAVTYDGTFTKIDIVPRWWKI